MLLFLCLSPVFIAAAVVLWRVQVAAARGRPQQPYERRAILGAILVANLALLALVVRILRAFGAVEGSSDPSQYYRIMSDQIGAAAATTYALIVVPLAIVAALSVVASRRHRRRAIGPSADAH
jgi:hypothetical protein